MLDLFGKSLFWEKKTTFQVLGLSLSSISWSIESSSLRKQSSQSGKQEAHYAVHPFRKVNHKVDRALNSSSGNCDLAGEKTGKGWWSRCSAIACPAFWLTYVMSNWLRKLCHRTRRSVRTGFSRRYLIGSILARDPMCQEIMLELLGYPNNSRTCFLHRRIHTSFFSTSLKSFDSFFKQRLRPFDENNASWAFTELQS